MAARFIPRSNETGPDRRRPVTPYKRYDTNIDEWLLGDRDWIAMEQELLLSPRSHICGELFSRDELAKMVKENREGRIIH